LAHAKRIGIDTAVLKIGNFQRHIFFDSGFGILIGVIALSKSLGFPLPWLRLSVIGALTYETTPLRLQQTLWALPCRH
jgi:hypothetical protein